METPHLIDALREEGARLADAAAGLPLDSPIPTCPGWSARDLLRHVGGIHRWAGTHVRDARPSLVQVDDLVDLFGDWPPDDELVGWYRAEHALLVESLTTADPDLACFAFLPAPSPLHFWARRQAHETTIHRADVESVSGSVSPIAPALAADGIDELVAGFLPRPRTSPRTDGPRTLRIAPDDIPTRWLLRLGPGPVVTTRDPDDAEPADCTVRGPAADLYLALWNRRGIAELTIDGDATLPDLFREKVTIRWS